MDTNPEMKAFLEKLVPKLTHYGPVAFTQNSDGSVEVDAAGENGYTVRAATAEDGIAVGYDGWHWHEDFNSVDEAISCFMDGVFGETRLAVVKRGGFAQSWTVEAQLDGNWVPVSTTGLIFFPFWRKRTVQYRRNDRIARQDQE